MEAENMSDLAATGCCNNDCGCGNNTGLFNGGDGCSCMWIILLLLFCGGNGSTFSNCGNNSSCDLLILILLIGMLLKYLTDGSGSDGTFLKICHGYFGKNYISVRYGQIQYMEIRQNFIARAFGIRKGEIHLLASSANTSHGIPYFKGNEHERIRQGMLGL